MPSSENGTPPPAVVQTLSEPLPKPSLLTNPKLPDHLAKGQWPRTPPVQLSLTEWEIIWLAVKTRAEDIIVENARRDMSNAEMEELMTPYESILMKLGLHGAEPAIRGCYPAERTNP